MTHYEVLGVAATATPDEIRRAYLVLARQHHPDFHTSSGQASVRSAEARMREINAAWQALGDDERRRAYDRTLARHHPDRTVGGAEDPVIQRPSSEFRPYFAEDADDDDSWRYEPDQGDPDSVPPTPLLVAPPALAVLGVVLLVISLSTGLAALLAVGVICLVFSGLLFVGVPVIAMFRSQSTEERASRRR